MPKTSFQTAARLLLLLTLALSWGCKDDNGNDPKPGEPKTTRALAYAALNAKFQAGTNITAFRTVELNSYEATLSDGSKIALSADLSTTVCTPTTWPQVKKNTLGEWLVGSINTKVTPSTSPVEVVTAIYDGEGLYIRCSDGSIMFFHYDAARTVGCFRFEKANNSLLGSDIIATIGTSSVTASMPSGLTLPNLVATVATRGTLKYGGNTVTGGTITCPVATPGSLSVNYNGADTPINIVMSAFKRIPVMNIITDGGAAITSKDDYINATVELQDPDNLYCTEATTGALKTEIRGRGNSTWDMPKKPYKLKLDKKKSLLGMSTDKEWALLANYSDKTAMRNYVAFEMARYLGMPWTPQNRPVEVYLNGNYQGQYMLTEHVKVSTERVNVEIVGTTDLTGDAITGGYFMELDGRLDGDTWFKTTRDRMPIVFKEPKIPEAAQTSYVTQYFNDTETALYGSNFKSNTEGYAKYIDVPSFVRNYLVQELTKNIDGNLRLSNYFSKARNGKLALSNVWDFDIAIGNCNYFHELGAYGNGYTGFYVKDFSWYKRLFEDPAFVAEVKKEWAKLYAYIPTLMVQASDLARQMEPAQARNFQKWPILNTKVWPNIDTYGSYSGEVTYMLKFLTDRANWLNAEFNKL